jgi:hypothetical protein
MDKNRTVLLDQLAEFMAQEADEMSDEELLEETGGVTGDTYARVQKLKQLLEERAAKGRQKQLASARAGYAAAMAARTRVSGNRPPIEEVRERIKTLFTNKGEVPLAVAWRNGENQTDEDLFSLWDQLCELGAIEDHGDSQ